MESSSSTFGGDADPFDIPAKGAPLERRRRWRQAALVLNASRRFRYTLDLKKEEEKEEIRRRIRARADVIRDAFLSKEAGRIHVQSGAPAPLRPLPQDHMPVRARGLSDLRNNRTASSRMYRRIFRDNPDFVDFPATASANGSVDTDAGSCRMHAPNHLSVRHPLLQMFSLFVRLMMMMICCQRKTLLAGWLILVSKLKRLLFATADMEKKISSDVPGTTQSGDDGFSLHFGNAKGNHIRKNIFTLRRGSNGGSTLEGTSSMPTGGHRETGSASSGMPVVILDSQAQATCTGNFNVFSKIKLLAENIVLVAANGDEMPTYMSGSVRSRRFQLDDVHYCPELGDDRIIVSGSVLDNLGYHYGFGSGKCCVKDLRTGRIVGEGRLINGDYIMDYLEIPRDRTPETEQPTLVSSVWNTFCSALCRLGLNPQGH